MEWIFFVVFAALVLAAVLIRFIRKEKARRHFMSFMEGLNLTGLPIVTLSNNGVKLNFVLDSGSAHSILQKEMASKLVYEPTDYVCQLSGIDNILRDEEETVMMKLDYKDKIVEGLFVLSDLSGVFSAIKQETGVQLHGLLGSDFFRENRYIIDYNELVAYSKKV